MAAAPSKKKKQDNPAAVVGIFVVILGIAGFAFKDKILGKKKPGRPGQAVASPGAPGSPGAEGSASALTPGDIPILSEEIRRKLTDRKGGETLFTLAQIEGGTNPFLPLSAEEGLGLVEPEPDQGGGPEPTTLSVKLTFWGGFPGEEGTKAIIEVEGEPAPVMVLPGQPIGSTPFLLKEFLDGGKGIRIYKPSRGKGKPFNMDLYYPGEERGKGRKGPAADEIELVPGGTGGGPTGSLDRAFDR